MDRIREDSREIELIGKYDICVVGGGCTGVLAAVSAARLGAKVAIIENCGMFGGVATTSMVNIWHSRYDITGGTKIIGGLTEEIIHRLGSRSAIMEHGERGNEVYAFNPADLAIELDSLLIGAGVDPFLHTLFASPISENGTLAGVAVEDVSGRHAIGAEYFVDCTGDGSLIARMGLGTRKHEVIQPPTMCSLLQGLDEIREIHPDFNIGRAAFDSKYEEALPGGFLWSADVTGLRDIRMVAGTRVAGSDCSEADQLTRAEMEGRRQVRAMCDILRKNFLPQGRNPLVCLASKIGIRDTRHAECLHTLTEREVLRGKRFSDGIANGTYRVDIHLPDRPGVIFRYLDGREELVGPHIHEQKRWLNEGEEAARFYQIPYESLVPKGSKNILVAGRLVDADPGAYGAIRVMVNCNQTGEAAGTASKIALDEGVPVSDVDPHKLRETMKKQGSIIV
ncbi:MAG: FAD-dependent oxidoreductase [Theionarchaea archaeon]|nr:FAD-dependent oxidoreductase [Theionarchaea archaeon]